MYTCTCTTYAYMYSTCMRMITYSSYIRLPRQADLQASKSCCKQEIQQLFPLPQKSYEVTIVKPPAFTFGRTNEKIQVTII